MAYILREDGSRILREGGAGGFLREVPNTSLSFGANNSFTGTGTSIPSSAITTQASNSLFIVTVSSTSLTGVTDNKGNTYTLLKQQTNTAGDSRGSIYYAVGAGGAGHIVTCAFSSSGSRAGTFIEIVNGALGSIDVNMSVEDTSSPFGLTTPALAATGELALAFIVSDSVANPATPAESTGWNLVGQQTNGSVYWVSALYSLAPTTTAPLSPSLTMVGAGAAVLLVATIRPAGDPGSSLAETLTLSDISAATQIVLAVLSEATAAGETGTAVQTTDRDVLEAASSGDSSTGGASSIWSTDQVESPVLDDSSAGNPLLPVGIGEAVTTVDGMTSLAGQGASLVEPTGWVDSSSTQANLLVNSSEGLSPTEVAATLSIKLADTTEATSVAQAASVLQMFLAGLTEAVTGSAPATVMASMGGSQVEVLAPSDELATLSGIWGVLNETVSLLTSSGTSLVAAGVASEGVTASNTLAQGMLANAVASGAISLADGAAPVLALYAVVSNAAAVSAGAEGVGAGSGSVSEDINTQDTRNAQGLSHQVSQVELNPVDFDSAVSMEILADGSEDLALGTNLVLVALFQAEQADGVDARDTFIYRTGEVFPAEAADALALLDGVAGWAFVAIPVSQFQASGAQVQAHSLVAAVSISGIEVLVGNTGIQATLS